MKLIIFTHGNVAREMHKASEMILGEHSFITAISLNPDDNVEKKAEELKSSVGDSSAVVLTDFIGGSPFNESFKVISQRNDVFVFTGVNMPMVLSAIEVISEGEITKSTLQQIKSDSVSSIKVGYFNYFTELTGD